MQSEINIKVGNKAPKDYFGVLNKQMIEQTNSISGITTEQQLLSNLTMNCVPVEIMQMSVDDYSDFLTMRRKLMATKMKDYYYSL
jgi:hypothetical protein